VRWLDFTARPLHVVEPDGRVVLEGATEGMDVLLGHIPAVERGNTGKPGCVVQAVAESSDLTEYTR
jgi:hypothetical protein